MPDEFKCEWCGTHYPKHYGIVFYQLQVFGKTIHTICVDCYEHLEEVKGC